MRDKFSRLWAWIVVHHWGKFVLVCTAVGLGVFWFGIGLVEISDAEGRQRPFTGTALKEVLHNTFDDGQGSVYIKVDNPLAYDNEKSLTELMNKKREWEREFPDKKIGAMSLYDRSSSGTSTVLGLLIHYEPR